MHSSNTHSINRINTDIFANRKALGKIQALGISSMLEQCFETLLPQLDEKFGEGHLRLASLFVSVDIKNTELDELENCLIEALQKAINSISINEEVKSSKAYEKAKDHTPEEAFLYFLETGSSPWFSSRFKFEKIDFSKASFITNLRQVLANSELAGVRMVLQLEKNQLTLVLSKLYPAEFTSQLLEFINLITSNVGRFSKRFAAGFRLQQHVLISALKQLHEGNTPMFKDFLKSSWPTLAHEVFKECNGEHKTFLEFLGEQASIDLSPGTHDTQTNTMHEQLASYISKSSEDNWFKTAENGFQDLKMGSNKEALWNAVNAGVVLLHPFLKKFFDKVGLLENSKFISPAHQQRAICLLHYLATGQQQFPEEELLLPKFLCNFPKEHPIPRELPISDFEKEEVHLLLSTVLKHWKAVKNTSIEGLRVNFLQRKGVLEKDSLGYTLHIENKTTDILLDQLPWGLSAIHWPWMPKLLTIKWR
ncbi:MAG: contractile injection system tape measure protein [Flavobacteriaceae bacterium]